MAYQTNIYYANSEFHNVSPYLPRLDGECDHEYWLQQRKKDEEFINSFIKSKSRQSILKKVPFNLKIYEARMYLTDIISLKQEIETDCNMLDVKKDDFDLIYKEVLVKRDKINGLLLKFNNESISSLKRALERRKKKRIWGKKRRDKLKVAIKEKEESIKLKHELIDKLLQEKSKETESAKRKESLKRQADSVLHEVRRKKYEAKKMLNMLAALLKLRELRSQQEIAQGGYCSKQVTETFNNVINHFQDLWKKQIEIYYLEEKGLKVMLEENDLPEMKITAFQKTLNQWQQAIFGSPTSDNSCKYLTQSDDDINSFINIRREWDQYIINFSSPLSSHIPAGWILPPETDNQEWKSFVRSKKK